jgi:pimeloyl-ACP methyl ester carboxylesterase
MRTPIPGAIPQISDASVKTATPIRNIRNVDDRDVQQRHELPGQQDGAELTVLANAGHYPMFETPVDLATAIEEFLGRE